MAILKMPGFGDVEPIRIVSVNESTIDLYVPNAEIQTINLSENPNIDVADPATFGILLDQFTNAGGSISAANPYIAAFAWVAEVITVERLVSAFEYDLPF